MAKLPRGSGCGPSGWKYEHLEVLSDNSVIADSFVSVCDLIAKGSFPSSVSGLLSGSKLIALPKTGGDVRPIAIGECLRRVTAKVICRQKKESFATYFEPIQHGVAVEGGTERLVHHVNLLLESHDDWVLLKSDIKNALIPLKELHYCQWLKSHVLISLSMYKGCTQNTVLLFFNREVNPFCCHLKKVFSKGIPLVLFFFSLTIHPLLLELQERHSSLQLLAYLDDVFLLGSLEDVLQPLMT